MFFITTKLVGLTRGHLLSDLHGNNGLVFKKSIYWFKIEKDDGISKLFSIFVTTVTVTEITKVKT